MISLDEALCEFWRPFIYKEFFKYMGYSTFACIEFVSGRKSHFALMVFI